MNDTKRKVGKVSWSMPSRDSSNSDSTKKVPFFEMKDHNKSYKMRVVSESPLLYWCHWTVNSDGKKSKVNCSLDKDCPVIDDKTKSPCGGQKGEAKYYIKVLDRSDGKIKVLDCGSQIVKAIGELHRNEDWGHSTQYDITVRKAAKGTNPLYTIAPSPKTPLTAAEQALVEAAEDSTNPDFIDLEARIKPMLAETIHKIVFGSDEGRAPMRKAAGAPTPQPKAGRAPVQETEEEDIIEWDETEE